jgi:hypothetical protein
MGIKTVWPIEHICGHREDHDLSAKRPSERAGYARWLATKDCSGCWRATRDAQHATDNETWLAERRTEEATAIRTWETRAGMYDLDGSERSAPWGAHVRYQLLSAAHEHHVTDGAMSDDEYESRFEVPARTVTSASWWIDQRDTDPADLEELLADVAVDVTAQVQENPY